MNERDLELINVTCTVCNNIFQVKLGTFKRRSEEHNWKCKKCTQQGWRKNLSDDERKLRAEIQSKVSKKYWASLTKEDKQKISDRVSIQATERHANMTDEQKVMRSSKISETKLEYWSDPENKNAQSERMSKWYENMPDEQKKERSIRLSESNLRFWANTTDEYRTNHSEVRKNWWATASEEQISERNRRHSESMKLYISELSEELQKLRLLPFHKGQREWFQNLTEDERKELSQKMSDGRKRYWASLTKEQQQIIIDDLHDHYIAWYDSLTDEEKIEHGQQCIAWYYKLSDEEKIAWAERSSRNVKAWHDSLSESERTEWINSISDGLDAMPDAKKWLQSQRMSAALREFWKNITPEWYTNWNFNRLNGLYRSRRKEPQPQKTESEFMVQLEILKLRYSWIEYQYQYRSIKKHESFDTLFPINPVTGGVVRSHHRWDFIIHTAYKDILVDLDGSMHAVPEGVFMDNGMDVAKSIQFNDSQRPYQTDGLDAYIIMCYNDNLTDDTPVLSLQTGEIISLTQLYDLISVDRSIIEGVL